MGKSGKSWKTIETHGKIMENHRNSWENHRKINGNHGDIVFVLTHTMILWVYLLYNKSES